MKLFSQLLTTMLDGGSISEPCPIAARTYYVSSHQLGRLTNTIGRIMATVAALPSRFPIGALWDFQGRPEWLFFWGMSGR